MKPGQALLAALPAALAIYFEFATRVPEIRAEEIARKLGLTGDRGDYDYTDIANAFAEGTLSLYSVRPTVVSVVSTSLAVIYELPERRAFFGAAALVVVLLVMLPVFSWLESLSPITVASEFVNWWFPHTLRDVISWAIVGLNLGLIAVCGLTYYLTQS